MIHGSTHLGLLGGEDRNIMSFTTCNEEYRNGGEINETEPHVWDTVDWFNRAAHDYRVVGNQLRSMSCLNEDAYEEDK